MREQPQDNLQELRLVGVHDDGQHLLLSAGSGADFRLPLDEALRRAVARPAPQRPAPSGAANMTPREIQAEIRAGATAESIAEASGIPLARVQRFESPVLAEREHVVRLAQACEVGITPPAHSAFAAEFGEGPAHLGDVVSHRLAVYGVNASRVEWDSWRRRDGLWTVVARFELPDGTPSSIGEEPPATWTYNPVRRSVANANRWAQQLSELETIDGPTSPRRLSIVDRPFDVEEEPQHSEQQPERRDPETDLLDMLRARRGQRLGVDEDADDALALLLTQGIPAAHPRPADAAPERPSRKADAGPERPSRPHEAEPERPSRQGSEHDDEPRPRRLEPVRDGITSLFPRLPRVDEPVRGSEDSHLRLAPGLNSATREITIVPGPTSPLDGPGRDGRAGRSGSDSGEEDAARTDANPDPDDARGEPTAERLRPREGRGDKNRSGGTTDSASEASASSASVGSAPGRSHADEASAEHGASPEPVPEPARRSSRSKRSSIPSWDEIVFGTKGE